MQEALASATFAALGTTVAVVTLDSDSLAPARRAVELEVAAIDDACSRFRGDSALSRVNAAPDRWVEAGELLCEALAAALRAAAATDGRVDPTVGRTLGRLGYIRDFHSSPPSPDDLADPLPAGRWREIEIDPVRARVRIPSGVSLDLGATAKALAADRASALAARQVAGVLVSLGGDISVAGATPEQGWSVRVGDDHRAPTGAPGQTISLAHGGLATSSTTVRTWHRGAHPVHHIVDPRTGAPAPVVWRTVSVAAASCLDANISSTACIVQGEGAVGWLEERALPARLVRPSGEIVTCAGWPADELGTAVA